MDEILLVESDYASSRSPSCRGDSEALPETLPGSPVTSTTDIISQLGANIRSFNSLLAALQHARRHTPDLLIIEESSTLLSPRAIIELKRQCPELDSLPSVYLAIDDATRKLAAVAGFEEVILLPSSDKELLARLSLALQTSVARGLAGSLAEVSIFDLIQMLFSGNKTGRLEISCGERKGLLHFDHGQVFHAETFDQQRLSGESAFLEILRFANRGHQSNEAATKTMTGFGRFRFKDSTAPEIPRTIEKRTDHLLLALASSLDELSSEV